MRLDGAPYGARNVLVPRPVPQLGRAADPFEAGTQSNLLAQFWRSIVLLIRRVRGLVRVVKDKKHALTKLHIAAVAELDRVPRGTRSCARALANSIAGVGLGGRGRAILVFLNGNYHGRGLKSKYTRQ